MYLDDFPPGYIIGELTINFLTGKAARYGDWSSCGVYA
ncbi:hypothetical protein BVRB_3g066740 [Beta vulgaris subsp. vulgaris]|nr:hypothetical protein BVRB_3g066740 [Beta vulgaris subsp. vulgaris]